MTQLPFHAVNHVECVLPEAHDYDAAHCLAFAVPFRNPTPNIRAERDGTDIANENWRAILCAN